MGNDGRPSRVGTAAAPGLVASAVVAIGALVVALRVGGGAPPPRLAGLPDAGPVVGWGLPILRTVADLSLIATVGTALLAVLLPVRRVAAPVGPGRTTGPAPPSRGGLSAEARTALRVTATAAGCAAAALAATALLAFADEVGSLSEAMSPGVLATDLPADASSTDLLASAVILLATAVAAGWGAHRGGADATSAPLLLGFAAVLPIALTGHSATGAAHGLAMASLGVHLLAVCTWVGGLGALTGYALHPGRDLARVLLRFSTVAGACYAAVGASGVVNAATRLSAPAQLATTGYGRLVVAKAVAYGLLGLLALGQRRRVLPALAATLAVPMPATPTPTFPTPTFPTPTFPTPTFPTPATPEPAVAVQESVDVARRAFARLAGAEVLVMAATVGLAVALSRTPPPGG